MIVAVKDLGEVDNDYFLIPVGIRDHEGPLHTSFPIENRLLPQGALQGLAAPLPFQVLIRIACLPGVTGACPSRASVLYM